MTLNVLTEAKHCQTAFNLTTKSSFTMYMISDVKKMPLGKLSKVQIAKGFECLEAIEDALRKKAKLPQLQELTSKFYTAIPHDFGRQRPPTLTDDEQLRKKFDMLLVKS